MLFPSMFNRLQQPAARSRAAQQRPLSITGKRQTMCAVLDVPTSAQFSMIVQFPGHGLMITLMNCDIKVSSSNCTHGHRRCPWHPVRGTQSAAPSSCTRKLTLPRVLGLRSENPRFIFNSQSAIHDNFQSAIFNLEFAIGKSSVPSAFSVVRCSFWCVSDYENISCRHNSGFACRGGDP